ncbi:MAG: GAF domain-containing protein [Tenuifilaceae bacterium]|nr:GAF domain-containing protein [Tenuifilaceae bacterium]
MPTKIFKNNPRFSSGILLVLLMASIAGTFFSLHNQIVRAGVKTPILSVLLTILAVLIAFLAYQQFTLYRVKLGRANAELKKLKEAVVNDKKEAKEQKDLNSESIITKQTDLKQEAANVIPTETFNTLDKFLEKLLSNIAKKHDIVQAVAFEKEPNSGIFQMVASYAYFSENEPPSFTEGVSLPGQVAKNKAVLNLTEVPTDYTTVLSGLGKGSPSNLLIVPVLDSEKHCNAIIEFSSFTAFDESKVTFFENLGLILGEHIKTIGNSTKQ